VTFHFHAGAELGIKPVDPSLPGYSRQGYMGDGGGWREEPMQEHFCKLKRSKLKIIPHQTSLTSTGFLYNGSKFH
jgi:hypothetical protein